MEVAEQEPDRRRLAGPVRTEEAEDLALVDLDVEVRQCPYRGSCRTARSMDRAPAAVRLREAVRRDRAHDPRLHLYAVRRR
jgi:hypothetical protein